MSEDHAIPSPSESPAIPFAAAPAKPAKAPKGSKAAREKRPLDPARRTGIRNVVLVVGVSLLTLSLIAGSIVIGWASANSLVVSTQSNPQPEVITIALPDYQPGANVRMPDVRGLTVERAQQAIVDAGVPISLVSVTTQPAAGLPGVVIQQTPVFGTANPTAAQIVVSEPAVMPEVIGLKATDVIASLQSLGARVTQQRAYVPGATVGTVVSVDAAAGETVPEAVTVVIADSPYSLALHDIRTSSGNSGSDFSVLVGGTSFDRAITLSTSSSASTTAWSFGGKVTLVQGAVGVEDGTNADYRTEVVFRLDGAELGRVTVVPGAATAFSYNVSGGSTFTIERTRIASASGSILLLDTALLGTYDDLSTLK